MLIVKSIYIQEAGTANGVLNPDDDADGSINNGL
jgi:hypothetical protein